jgi:hypothetical protein
VLESLPPFLTGGSMITTVTLDRAEYLPPPQRFEAGTQPVGPAIGLAAAVRYLDAIGLDRIHAHEGMLAERMRAGLAEIPGIRLLGDAAGSSASGCGPSTSTACTPMTPASTSMRGASPSASATIAPRPALALRRHGQRSREHRPLQHHRRRRPSHRGRRRHPPLLRV